jgi:hypothetical protein
MRLDPLPAVRTGLVVPRLGLVVIWVAFVAHSDVEIAAMLTSLLAR